MRDYFYKTTDSIINLLVHHVGDNLSVVTDLSGGGSNMKEMEHLTCFIGGTFALGAMNMNEKEEGEHVKSYLRAGDGVANVCHSMYTAHQSGLHGENIIIMNKQAQQKNSQYLQRPESIETWFYMWRATGDQKYRDYAWSYMEAINKCSKTTYGYDGLRTANDCKSHDDVQQSWFVAETLKYLYLIFAPNDVLPLDKFVFNTEAHALSPFDPTTSYNIPIPKMV